MIDFESNKPRQHRERVKSAEQVEAEKIDFEEVVIEEKSSSAFRGMTASELNDVMAVVLGVFLFIAPIPFGAHRPLAWLVLSALLAIAGILYTLAMARLDPARVSQTRHYRPVLALGGVFLALSAAQLLPISFGAFAGIDAENAPEQLTLSRSATLMGLLRMASYGVLFALVLEVCTNRNRTERLLRMIFWIIVIHAFWALVSLTFLNDTLLFQEKTAYQGFATGTFVNRNSFATFLAMGLVLGVSQAAYMIFAPKARSPRRRTNSNALTMEAVVKLAFCGIILTALIATGSRLGLVSALLGCMFAIISIMLKNQRYGLRTIASVSLGSVLLVVILVVTVGGLSDRLVFVGKDAGTRITLFQQTWDMILARPFLGYGLDAYSVAFEAFHTPELITWRTWELPHNTYLTLWSEVGLFVGSLPPLAVALAFVYLMRNFRMRERSYVAAITGAGVIVTGAVHSLADFSLEMAANTYMFVALIALGLARRRRQMSEDA